MKTLIKIYCDVCKKDREISADVAFRDAINAHISKGTCPVCNSNLFRINPDPK